MRVCPKCQRSYDRNEIAFCLDDGTPLTGGAEAFAPTMAPSGKPLIPAAPGAAPAQSKPPPQRAADVGTDATMAPSGPPVVPAAPAVPVAAVAPTMAPSGPSLVPAAVAAPPLSPGAAAASTMAPSGKPLIPAAPGPSGTAIGVPSVAPSQSLAALGHAVGVAPRAAMSPGAGAPLGDSMGGMSTNPAEAFASTMAPTSPLAQGGAVLVTAQDFPPPVNPLDEGAQVGEYLVGRKIGEGGMGVIYAGVHPIIGKKVALKVLNREMAHNPDVVQRFIQEAKSVNQIGHRNIVDIFSFGRLSDGRHYFAMEFLEGQSLSSRLAAEVPVSWSDAIQIWLQVSAAIDAAHQQGIVHRDLKPDNIFLSPSPEGPFVKVLDFGIAKLLGDTPAGLNKTGTGVPIGTPAYMSPEQARGSAVDHRTDLYAFGIIMFETITGRPPFLHQSFVQLLTAHLTEDPPAIAGLADIHPDLNALVVKLLAKEPEDRLTDMTTVRAELVRLRDLALNERRPLYAPLGELAKMVLPTEERASVLMALPEDVPLTIERPIAVVEPPPPKASRLPLYGVGALAAAAGLFAVIKLTEKPPVVIPPVVAPPPVVIAQPPPSSIPKGMGRLQVTSKIKTRVYVDPSETQHSQKPLKEDAEGTFKLIVPSGKIHLRYEAAGQQPITYPVEVEADTETTLPQLEWASVNAPKQAAVRAPVKGKVQKVTASTGDKPPLKPQGPGEKPTSSGIMGFDP